MWRVRVLQQEKDQDDDMDLVRITVVVDEDVHPFNRRPHRDRVDALYVRDPSCKPGAHDKCSL